MVIWDPHFLRLKKHKLEMRFHQSFSVVSCCFFTRGSISYLSFTCFSAVSFSQGCTIGLKKLLHILFCYLALHGFHFGDQILHPQSGGDHPNDPIIVVVTTSITTTSTFFFSNFHGKILVRPNLKGMSSLHSPFGHLLHDCISCVSLRLLSNLLIILSSTMMTLDWL